MQLYVGLPKMVVPYRTNARSLALLAIMISVFLLAHGQAFPECGGYHFVNPGESKIITSPNHPDAYPEYSRCIWVARTQENYRVRFTITYRGERFNGSCADYVEVRDGGQFAPLLATFCDNSTNEQVTSGYIYMWVLFSSDAQQTYGSPMSATFTAYYNASPPDNTTKPFTDCRSYEFECSNSMCASMSYRCDAYNDCGCKAGCDEDKCYDLVISKAIQIVVSLAVGVVTFVMVAIFSFLLEGQHSWITALAEANRERETRDEMRRRRVSRVFSKFIGGGGGGDSSFPQDYSSNALKGIRQSPPPAAASHQLKGPIASLVVPPQPSRTPRSPLSSHTPRSETTDITVTDMEA